jgi:hypothetical protein
MGIRIEFSPHLIPLMDNPTDRAFFSPGIHPKYEEDHHPPPKTDKHEKEEQRSFMNYCLLHGYPAVWHAMHKPSTATPGTPDFVVPVNRKVLFIEFKNVGASLSKIQEEYRAKLEAQGHVLYVVHSHAEAIQLCKEADRLI